MSAFHYPPSPPLPPTPPRTPPSFNSPQEDVDMGMRSPSPLPSRSLTVPQTSGEGVLTPPITPVKTQHSINTTPSTIINCPISKASFLLAQASLATELSGASSMTEFNIRSQGSLPAGTRTLRFGPGLDGCFNRTRGFLGGQESTQSRTASSGTSSRSSGQRLPVSLEPWEAVHGNLPLLLRAGRVRQAVDALGNRAEGVTDAWDDLEPCHLARAALVLSALAHAYMFGEEQGKGKDGQSLVPRHILATWERVCERLGRSMTGRVPADDVLNNAVGNSSFSLRSTYFGLSEERLSSGLQGTMEAVFAPALSSMALAQNNVLADQPDQVARCLESVAARIVKCAHVFDAMTPRDTANFDPVIWIKTYPAMGRAVTSGELGNSGVDAPLFHALDVFIGRQQVKGDLRGMQSDRRATLPANIRAFLDALGDDAGSVRDYVTAARAQLNHVPLEEQAQYKHLSAAWDGLLQLYVWFLERHRVKAVGITGVTLNTGRHSTSSGVKSGDQVKAMEDGKPKLRPEAMLSMQMKKGMVSRLGGRPLWQDAYVQSHSVYQGSVVVAVKLDASLPLEPGDRVQVWPPTKRKTLNRASSHHRRLRGSPCSEDHDTSSGESDDDGEPRFYSIARVIPNVSDTAVDSVGGGGMTIVLTVAQHSPEGLVSSFLGSAAPGTHLRLRPWPSPRFRQPRDLAVPLVLVGQGVGIGPLVGFLHDRAAMKQRLDDSQNKSAGQGELLLVVAAKTLRHVPCSLESLEQLTRTLPLTIVLALSQETHLRIRGGIWTKLPQEGRRVTRHLTDYRDFIRRLVKEKSGHVFVCGSSDFGVTVMSALGLGQSPQQQQQHQERLQPQNANDEPDDGSHVQIPSPPAHWNQLHQDLFTMVKKPNRSTPSCSPTACRSSSSSGPKGPIISLSKLAAHNSVKSCWVAIGGTVYDMTPFLAFHPGGPKTLLESAGTIADERFAETHGGPHAQEIRGYLERHAIGRLSTTTTEPRRQMTTAKLIKALVRMQNALTNNTAFDAGRGSVPLYAYEDSLLVFADGLDGMICSLSDFGTDKNTSELRENISNTQASLRNAFKALKDGSKRFLMAAGTKGSSASSSTLLDESEVLIQRLHRKPIEKLHAAIDACKKGISEAELGMKSDSSTK
ncbi:Cytochrome b5 reductase 4, partial [Colletotrichum gloeosporioides]